jgi:hypothetical protein
MYGGHISKGGAAALPFTGFASLRFAAVALILVIVGIALVRAAMLAKSGRQG